MEDLCGATWGHCKEIKEHGGSPWKIYGAICGAVREAVREAVRGPTCEESLWSLSREDHHGRLSEPFVEPFVELLHSLLWKSLTDPFVEPIVEQTWSHL